MLSSRHTRLMRRDASTWVPWVLVPWREAAVALSLIAAAAAPAFLVAASGVWQSAAGNEVTARLAEVAPPTDRTLIVQTDALFVDGVVTATADARVRQRLDDVVGFGPVSTTLFSVVSDRGVMATSDGEVVNVSVRFVEHSGAIAAVDQIARAESAGGGVWISDWFAAHTGLDVGDTLRSAECDNAGPEEVCVTTMPAEPITVVGVYRALWSPDDSDPSQGVIPGLDRALIPQFVRPFGVPNYALLLSEPGFLGDAGVAGTARWSIEREGPVETLGELRSLVGEVRSVERSVVQDRSLSDAVAALSQGRGGGAGVASSLPGTLAEAERAVADLQQPLGSALTAGIVMGVGAMVAGAAFSVSRRRTEFRLLASEGDRWPEFSSVALGQLLAPTAVGTAVGVLAAVAVGGLLAPANNEGFAAVDLTLVILIALLGLAVAALTTGLLGQRSLDESGFRRSDDLARIVFGAVALVSMMLWIQVGRAGQTSEVDVAVVLLPIAVLVSAVMAMLGLSQWVLVRTAGVIERAPTPVFLAWHRIARRDLSSRLVIGALAVAVGFSLFSASLVSALERSVDAKLATELGGETLVELIGRPDVVPAGATVVSVEQTRVTPGDRRVRIVAVDAATFADAVSWPDSFGMSIEEAGRLLGSDAGDDVPVIALAGQTLPRTGSFGLRSPVRYEIVGRAASVPLASSTSPTLLVDRDRVDDFVLGELLSAGAIGNDGPGFVVSPTESYRQRLVSSASASSVEAELNESGTRYLEIRSASLEQSGSAYVAPRFAFDYLRILGLVAVAAALIALTLFLASRRAARRLAAIMTSRMGLSRSASALISSLEVMVLTAIGALAALVVTPAITARLLPRFDPSPDTPPTVPLDIAPLRIIGGLLVGLAVIGTLVWIVEFRAGRKGGTEVLRGST